MLGLGMAMTYLKIIAALFITIYVAQLSAIPTLSKQETSIIKQASNYLNNLKNLSADLRQFNGDGRYIVGKLLIKDRANIRIDYKKPHNSIIYDGRRIIHIDNDIYEVSFISASNTPFSFLLNKKKQVDLAKDFFVAKVKLHKKQEKAFIFLLPKSFKSSHDKDNKTTPDFQLILTFKIINKDEDDDSKINKLTLDSWALIEGSTQYTRVELLDIKNNIKLDKSLFRYQRSTL